MPSFWQSFTKYYNFLGLCWLIFGQNSFLLKFMFSKKATKCNKNLHRQFTLGSKCQIYGEDFVIFCGLLRRHELKNHHQNLNNPTDTTCLCTGWHWGVQCTWAAKKTESSQHSTWSPPSPNPPQIPSSFVALSLFLRK